MFILALENLQPMSKPPRRVGRRYESILIVAFLKNLEEIGQVLFIAGQTAEGTEAAGKLATDLPRLDGTLKNVVSRRRGRNTLRFWVRYL